MIEKKPYHETIIYIRTSTTDQNPLNQLEACESIRPKDQKTETFVDYYLLQDTQSAFLDFKEREVFNALIKLIKKNKVKNLIVWDLDRIYRNRKKLLGFFEICKSHKCRVYSFRQGFLNDLNKMPYPWNETMFDLMISIFGWIAEEESLKKSDRVKSAVTKKQGITFSKFGNKWGRKELSTQKKNKIIELRKTLMSFRNIAYKLNISVGVVHKTYTNYLDEKIQKS